MSFSQESIVSLDPNSDGTGAQPWRWFWLALMLAPLPMFVHYLIWNWQYEQYHFFPLLLAAVAALAYSRFDGRLVAPRGWLAWAAIGLGMVAVIGSLAWDTPWLSTIAFVLFASALLASLSGPDDASLFGLSLPLWLLVRLPLGYDQLLVLWLQSITTQLTSVVLDAVRVPHAVSGNVIQLADRELFVAEACSGIQSVFTLAFISSLLVAIYRRPLFTLPLYLVVSGVLAVAANVLRVSTVAMAQAWFELDLASGWPHDAVGYLALAIGIGLLLSFDHLLLVIFHPLGNINLMEVSNPLVRLWSWATAPRRVAAERKATSATGVPFVFGDRRVQQGLLLGTSSLAIVLFFASMGLAFTRQVPVGGTIGMFAATGPVFEPQQDLFADAFTTLRVVDHLAVRDGENPRLGENADVWTVEIAGRQAQLVLSQTYTSWHEFCFCYQIDGWTLLNRAIEFPDDQQDELPCAVALFSKEGQQMGQLLYAAVDTHGNPVKPPEIAGRLSSRIGGASEQVQDVVMIQLWVVGTKKMSAEVYSKVKADFTTAIQVVSETLRQQHSVSDDVASTGMPTATAFSSVEEDKQ